MFKRFYPHNYVDSTYNIDFSKLYKKGFRGIIFDIDNTLVPHGAKATKEAEKLFEDLHKIGFKTCLLSNNNEDRVKMFLENIDSFYIHKANKPSSNGYKNAMKLMNTDPLNTLFVGDQIFTDLWGASKLNIPAILVKPIHPKEEIQIVLKRKLEKIVLFFYKKNIRYHDRLGDITKKK